MTIEANPPEVIDWAAGEPLDGPNTQEPDLSAQQSGWAPAPATPIRVWENYWKRGIVEWIRYILRTVARRGSEKTTAGPAAAFTADPTGIYGYKNATDNYTAGVFRAVEVIDGAPVGAQIAVEVGAAGALLTTSSPDGANVFTMPARKATEAEARAGSGNGVMTPELTRAAVAQNAAQATGQTETPRHGWIEYGAGAFIVLEEWGTVTIGSSGFATVNLRAASVYGVNVADVNMSATAQAGSLIAVMSVNIANPTLAAILLFDTNGDPVTSGSVYWRTIVRFPRP